jgi:hypothetical protein
MKRLLALSILLFAVNCFAGDLPDPVLTPGAINPEVTQENIGSTICVKGWTATIRPPVSYTNELKLKQMKQMGLSGEPSDFEEDHLISLELGGHPTNPENLWPEPWVSKTDCGARHKDHLENKLHELVCSGELELKQAQTLIASDWISAFNQYVLGRPAGKYSTCK